MSFTVSGVDGWLHLIAFVLFLAAFFAAFFGARGYARGGEIWPACVALGLCLWVLSLLVH
jgi:hypothetical protein